MEKISRKPLKTRAYPRTKIELPVHYKFFEAGKVFHALEATSKDLGPMGLGASSDRFIPSGQHIMINLYIPKEKNGSLAIDKECYSEEECLPVLVLAELVWCQERESNNYSIGVKFCQIEAEHQARFKNFLQANNLYRAELH